MAKRKVKAKKITKILIVIILLVLVFVGGSFYYVYNFSLKKSEPKIEEKKGNHVQYEEGKETMPAQNGYI